MDRFTPRLNPDIDRAGLARRFRSEGRAHVPDLLLAEDAEFLHSHLRGHDRWTLIFNQGDKLFELDRAAQAALDEKQKEAIDLAVRKGARDGFQFRFENIRVADGLAERSADPDPIARFAEFMSSEPVIALVREISGRDDIGFADAQATAYGPGHFLTRHDDDVGGKARRAAYVYNLSRDWNADWGGLLLFHGADGHVDRGFTPAFNALNLFAVPMAHSVSMVTDFTANRRYAITGWLRGGDQPG